LYQGQTAQPSTGTVVKVETERNVSLSFDGELDNGHYDALLPVQGNERMGIFVKVCFCDKTLLKSLSVVYVVILSNLVSHLYGMHPVVYQYHILSFISVKHNNIPMNSLIQRTYVRTYNVHTLVTF
jgi:hypothetical protein